MKKYIIGCILLVSISFLTYAENVFVTAKVGNLNSKPTVLSVNPANNPKLLGISKAQSYTLYFRDAEKDQISYTITPDAGVTNISNGIINTYDSQSGAYLNFTYFSPSSANPSEKIIITLNDGSGITTKQLNLYIY